MENAYYRPLVQSDPVRLSGAVPLAGGRMWFDRVEVLYRHRPSQIVGAKSLPGEVLDRLSAVRAEILGISSARPVLMGVLNVTPDSFSDGGEFDRPEAAFEQASAMSKHGISIIDIGGESTRPGANFVPEEVEKARVLPVIEAVRNAGIDTPISVDTRKAGVARAAIAAGADMFNDVSALTFDPQSLTAAAELGHPVCLMHAAGDPKTMQDNPVYNDVLLDIYDYLDARVTACVSAGIPRDRVVVDPGIGFGKTLEHNLTLIRGMSLFHGLGCQVLAGVSRKRFIGTLSGVSEAGKRGPGSIAAGLSCLAQGVQILRVHDIAESAQALAVWKALNGVEG